MGRGRGKTNIATLTLTSACNSVNFDNSKDLYYLEQNKLLVVAKISPLLFVQKKKLYSALQGTVVFTEDRVSYIYIYRTHIKYIAFCKIFIGQVLSTEVSIYYKSVVSIQVVDYIVLEKVLTMSRSHC